MLSLPIPVILKFYHNKYKELERKGGPGEDGELFEEVIGLEEGILEKFGLPASNKNKAILWTLTKKKAINQKHIEQTIEKLEAAAERFLFSPVLTDIEQLTHAKAIGKSAFDILPELGHPTHDYTILLYDTILDFVSPEEVLAELSALKRLDCYGEIDTLKNQYPRTFRKTKVYKQHKPYLKFLDIYLDPLNLDLLFNLHHDETDEYHPHPLEYEAIVVPPDFDERYVREQAKFSDAVRPDAIDFEPVYIILTDLVVIEEIIFGEDSAVTVIGKTNHSWLSTDITLGFDFDVLTSVLQVYRAKGQYVLNYFNKNRQLNAIDYPVVINLKDKTGSILALDQHYFKVYKPLTMGPSGKPEVIKEAFYIVDEVVDKARYDEQMADHYRSSLNGTFHHMKNHYYCYLSAKLSGMSDEEARRDNGLEDSVRFEVSKMLYLLEKHGGRPKMK